VQVWDRRKALTSLLNPTATFWCCKRCCNHLREGIVRNADVLDAETDGDVLDVDDGDVLDVGSDGDVLDVGSDGDVGVANVVAFILG